MIELDAGLEGSLGCEVEILSRSLWDFLYDFELEPVVLYRNVDGVAKTFYLDLDGDGYGDPSGSIEACERPLHFVTDKTDCNDSENHIHPTAEEVPYDAIDQDCNGSDLTDVDEDGYDAEVTGGPDCNDQDPEIHPGATEGCDSIDNNCSGEVDEGCP